MVIFQEQPDEYNSVSMIKQLDAVEELALYPAMARQVDLRDKIGTLYIEHGSAILEDIIPRTGALGRGSAGHARRA